MKGYAIQLGFTGESSLKLYQLFERTRSPVLALGGVPHLSLLVAYDEKPSAYVDLAKTLANKSKKFDLMILGLDSFSGPRHVTYLKVHLDRNLNDLHKSIHDELARRGIESDPYYLPNKWTPHITISMEDEAKKFIYLNQTKQDEIPKSVSVGSISVIRFRPVELLANFTIDAEQVAAGNGG